MDLGSRAGRWLLDKWRIADPDSRAWYTRAIYLDYIFNSAVGLFISLAIYLSWPGQPWLFLQAFMVVWTVYLTVRLGLGVIYARRAFLPADTMPAQAMLRWARLPILFQAEGPSGSFLAQELTQGAQAFCHPLQLHLAGLTLAAGGGKKVMFEVVAQGVEPVFGLLGITVAQDDGPRHGVKDGVVLNLHGWVQNVTVKHYV
jgi:hypothetical protein